MSLHVECLLLEVETAALEEAHRSYEACRLAGDTSGAIEQLVRVLATASRILDLSEAVLRQATAKPDGGAGPASDSTSPSA